MPDLLRLQTDDFEFSVWCNDITSRQQTYQSTRNKRLGDTAGGETSASDVRFSPDLAIIEASIIGIPEPEHIDTTGKLQLEQPLFFENLQYRFEWIFFNDVTDARLCHRLEAINNGFRFTPQRGRIPAMLSGTVHTGNHVGWLKLPLEYTPADGKPRRQSFSFEVLPTKMDLHGDLSTMYAAIDKTFPLWRFSLAEKTEQDAAQRRQRGDFPLLWLANFAHLREQFEQGLKVIARAPHRRLQPHTTHLRADRLKGRLPHKLAERAREDIANGRTHKRYRVQHSRLSVDTPENRFIKGIVAQSKKQLHAFENRLRNSRGAPDNQRISDSFLAELGQWQRPLQKMLDQSFLQEVRPSPVLQRESLVLQQKTGYSAVYRIWQQLKLYLDVFDGMTGVSMKSVAEIYEVWCFLSLQQILTDDLGFSEKTRALPKLTINDFFEHRFKDGFAGAFEFKREDGITARLAHEPLFRKGGTNPRTYLITQKPDIVLEVTLPAPDNQRFLWVFDAKYRINNEKSRFDTEDIDATDYVPDDAINQMHRYRDALIGTTRGEHSEETTKSRPVFAAFALYPGHFDQRQEDNPYADAIAEIGIGAFALLPSHDDTAGRYWLTRFLQEQIGTQDQEYGLQSAQEQLLVQEAARIPHYGMAQTFYPDLTMTAAVGGASGRRSVYFEAFANGSAQWYHMPQSTFHGKYRQHVVEEIRFLALATTASTATGSKQLDKLWPVKAVTLVPRYKLTAQHAGKADPSPELYYLFELGKPLTLQQPITHVPHRPMRNTMRLTTLSRLEQATKFCDVESVYQKALTPAKKL